MDPGETDLEAAIRETKEESGLELHKDYEISFEDFRIESNYMVNGEKSKPKRVVYWLAQAKSDCSQVRLSDEHKNFKWADLNDCLNLVQFDESRRIIREAFDRIMSSNNK